ncbi:MAG: polyketide synthase dehydratase domain-containing protein, partial [Desulfuromonadaceae bacterium]|nr:polyketide synthase dehydratase domain-containing protein [Desulfuromonadaceae bacterium]
LSLSNELQEDKKSIYADARLFHGPALQGLEQVLGLSAEGISAMAHNTATPASWMQTPLRHNWLSAPMLLDSSFQLMILWCFARQQCVSLPSYIRHYRQFVDTIPTQELTQINCLIRNSSASMVQADIDFVTPDSDLLLARIEGYECTMTDNLGGAFACNTLD